MVTYKPGEELRMTMQDMITVLDMQQSKRHEYQGTTWLDVEINVMHHVVNCERSKRGLPDIPREMLVRHERMAAGHTDYSSKFALYCAELAMGISKLEPRRSAPEGVAMKTYAKEQVASTINSLRQQNLPLYTTAADMLTSLLDEVIRLRKVAGVPEPTPETRKPCIKKAP